MSSTLDSVAFATTPGQHTLGRINGRMSISSINSQAAVRDIASVVLSGIFLVTGLIRLLQLQKGAIKVTKARNTRLVKLVSSQRVFSRFDADQHSFSSHAMVSLSYFSLFWAALGSGCAQFQFWHCPLQMPSSLVLYPIQSTVNRGDHQLS